MPTYTFYNKTTEAIEEHVMKISALDEFKAANPHLERRFDTPGFADPVRLGRVRIDNGFREVLQKISSSAIGGNELKGNIR